MNRSIALVACLALVGCTSADLKTSGALAPVAVGIASASSPTIAKDVADACAAALPVASTAVAMTKGGAQQTAASINNLVTASCSTPDAQAKLTANDKAGVTTDGGSAKWVNDLTIAAKVVQAVLPIAMALL